ncbi:MAG: thiosulfate oxidation carrier protein SoxY [Gammaproteobacteria bacterium]|nr:thiosulfate oxidation carrier protein SoxY [Gammaproteobacteria bacterium]NNJ95583.1 thiosulfate oxidation carrier protein SoxY [Gammaproteobacteria bacterium]
MNQNRRVMLKGSLAAGVVGAAVGAGLLTPKAVLAAWSKEAFEAKEVDAAMKGNFGSTDAAASDKIKLKAPDIAENGAVVPITVTSQIDGTTHMSILVSGNATPLTSTYELGQTTEAYISTRVKMGKTSDVIAVVKADGKLYSTKKEVKVTIGGCGG